MWAGSDVCGLLVENVGLLVENVGLKYRPFAQNVSRTKGIFVGPRDYVCGPLQVGMVSGNRFTKLLECPRCSGMGRHMGVEDTARGVFHHHKHVEQTKRGGDHYAEVACHDGLSVV